MADRFIRELALNFRSRMQECNLHGRYGAGAIYQKEVNTRMIEFFTGAYCAFRQAGREREARALGVYTKEVLSPLGYAAMCKTIAGRDELPEHGLLLDIPGLGGGPKNMN